MTEGDYTSETKRALQPLGDGWLWSVCFDFVEGRATMLIESDDGSPEDVQYEIVLEEPAYFMPIPPFTFGDVRGGLTFSASDVPDEGRAMLPPTRPGHFVSCVFVEAWNSCLVFSARRARLNVLRATYD
jgi:hypothetical protein